MIVGARADQSAQSDTSPGSRIAEIFDLELDTAAEAEKRGQKVYRSLQKLGHLIGGEYGERVLYELVQNAHDAHPEGTPGDVAIRLVVESEDRGVLYVANGGRGFSEDNLQAIRNIANSTKEVGEGIGNKGVGFRSVEALTDDPRIYSRAAEAGPTEHFDGFCFRFARPGEIEARLRETRHADVAVGVSESMPRYLAAIPTDEQPESVRDFARRGFATVVCLPLETAAAVQLARKQVNEILQSEVPILLFLERVRRLEIEVEVAGGASRRRTLTREIEEIARSIPELPGCYLQAVTMGPGGKRWLMVRRTLGRERVLDAVERSVAKEPGLKRWRNWKGNAVVSVAVPWSRGLRVGRLYNFLPMGDEAEAPLFAHLDAPFFTTIDRRRARLDLPLNAELLDAACEAAAAASLAISRRNPEIPPRIVVELAAWDSSHAARLRSAFAATGSALETAEVWPTSERGWASLERVRVWPPGKYRIITAPAAAAAGAAILAKGIREPHVDALRGLADECGVSIDPSPGELASWAEAVAARLPRSDEAARERWTAFYDEIASLLPSQDRLRALEGREIMLGREGQLLPAGRNVYVKHDGSRRTRGGAPLPPAELSRKLDVLSSHVTVRAETFLAFERAALWRRYNATDVLASLPMLFSDRPAPARRRAALLWAFEVWRHDTADAKKALATAKLQVPTRDGWAPASSSAFSDSWTPLGKHLVAFLAEAALSSPTCAQRLARVLDGWDKWPGNGTSKPDWIRFLGDAGVTDGLIPAATKIESNRRGDQWSYHLATVKGNALDVVWHTNHGFTGVYHPYTSYSLRGQLWWLPGQIKVGTLSDDAKKRFAILVLAHLQRWGLACLSCEVGRFERDARSQDIQRLHTPLATFLMTAAWFPVQLKGDEFFVPVAQAWLLTDRRSDPKFVPRAPDEVAEYLDPAGKVFGILSESPYGLRVWKEPRHAAARIAVLANVCNTLEQHERAPFRKQYDQAWEDLRATEGRLDPATPLVVERGGSLTAIEGGTPPVRVYIRAGRERELARLLVESGSHVLASGDEIDAVATAALVNRTGRYDARPVDEGSVQLLLDGAPFRPSAKDPLLTNVVPWLAEALVLGHEVGARDLEKTLPSSMLEERIRKVRLRECGTIELQTATGARRPLSRYIYRDDDRPTLIVAGELDAEQLSDSASSLSSLVHANLRSFEPLLLRLVRRLPQAGPLASAAAPSDRDYAFAVQADLDIVREHLAFRRTDYSRQLALIVPVIAYFAGADHAREMEGVLEAAPPQSWYERVAERVPAHTAELLFRLLDDVDDLPALRRALDLDYARLNQALLALGRTPLSNEPELRRQFEVWKEDLRSALRDRLRGHYAASVHDPAALKEYAALRELDFVTFDDGWVHTRETLDREDVLRRADQIFAERFDADAGIGLPELDALRVANRRILAAFARAALPVLGAAAGEKLPDAWSAGPAEVAAAADRTGVLDFAPVREAEAISTLVRAGLWPEGLPHTLDLEALGLTEQAVKTHAAQAAEQRVEEQRRRNRVDFGGRDFDASSPEFAADFAAFAEAAFRDGRWRARSKLKPVALRDFPETEPRERGNGRGNPPRSAPKLPEPIRAAMGLAGEILAYHFLAAKHRDRFSDPCWVSENRTSLFPEPGDPGLGFDFRVRTSETEWLYEVKATMGNTCEFELSDNEYRTAAAVSADRTRRYRILFVQYVFDPKRCRIMELPNPAAEGGRPKFRIVGRSSTRMKFDPD